MPRTKRPVRVQEKTGVKDDALKKLDIVVAQQKTSIDSRVLMECRNVELAFRMLLSTIDSTHLNKTMGQLKSELRIANSTRKTRNSSRATSHDDGYLTETSQGSVERGKKMAPPTTGRASRSRSADASARKMAAPAPATAKQRRRSRSVVYRTPAIKTASKHYPAITPKAGPQTPLTLLRHARQGEMLVSMSGSPVMPPGGSRARRRRGEMPVSMSGSPVMPPGGSMATDGKAHCNFMLKDGTMLSLQPNTLRHSQAFIPFSLMDAEVLLQLKTLQDNLAKVVKLGENVVNT